MNETYKIELKAYLDLTDEIKALEEERELHKSALVLTMQTEGTKKIYVEDLGEITLVEPKPRKTFVTAEAKKFLTEEQIKECTTEKPSTPFIRILSASAKEAQQKFLEKKNEES